ncbi:hypothetical protein GCM10012275_13980 [Longimycelium tulufanense]|uniref:PPE domain-containing protein n=1 Tax=Longimycelium tulufanense TaxID=907463 RepID=A0A8J3CC16_9PSEU|nr:PPE domain-containing protein [Longimycelium tulufanense]GGM44165.1 hypothetical protein GCM10012275_13980 [Longimycelium tulufanense]
MSGRDIEQGREELERQQRQLSESVDSRRSPVAAPCANYMGVDHPKLKEWVESGNNPGEAHGIAEAWVNLGNVTVEASQALVGAANSTEADWCGPAANAARATLTKLGGWSGETGGGLQLMGTSVGQQALAAEEANRNMPEPVEFNVQQECRKLIVTAATNPFALPGAIDQFEQKYQEKQERHERAAQVMQTMDMAFRDADRSVPAFTPPPPLAGSGEGDDFGDTGRTPPGGGGGTQLPPMPGTGGGVGGVGGGSGGGSSSVVTPQLTPPPGGGTTPPGTPPQFTPPNPGLPPGTGPSPTPYPPYNNPAFRCASSGFPTGRWWAERPAAR